MWNYLSPFQMMYEVAKPYKTPAVVWNTIADGIENLPQDWQEAVAAWEEFSACLKAERMHQWIG